MTAAGVQRGAGWSIVVVGAIHLLVTFLDYDSLSLAALWFAGTGLALVLIGGLNVVSAGLAAATHARLQSDPATIRKVVQNPTMRLRAM